MQLSCSIEMEIAGILKKEQIGYLKEFGLNESSLHKMIRHANTILDLETFFTAWH